ncbi:MAG: ChaN family lipoprotein [Gemmatimonadota bacterium]
MAIGLLTGCVSAPIKRDAGSPPASSIRVHDSARNREVGFNALVAAAADADIVYFGEQHDDPETHFAEFALLEGIGRVKPRVIVSLEMFERDVQSMVDSYLAGRMSEAEFLAASRPWPQYATDYRPLVVLARARGWPVIAANVPRSIASAVSRKGLSALDTMPAATRAHAAKELACPHDRYYDLFAEQMKGHSAGGVAASASSDTATTAMTDRFYEAQCVKDETMGESIANALVAGGAGAIVVHFDGAFHSDYALGTAERARRRAPAAKSIVITAVPVADVATAAPGEQGRRADYLIFTKKPAPKAADAGKR